MTEKCTRFKHEGLLALERGDPLELHFETCEDCLRERAIYRDLVSRLVNLGTEARPPAGYEARIFEQLARERSHDHSQAIHPSLTRWLALAAAVAAVVALTVWYIPRPGPPAREPHVGAPNLGPSLAIEIITPGGGRTARGTSSAKPGDQVVARGVTGGLPHAELRMWRGKDVLVERCIDVAPCRRGPQTLDAKFTLFNRGDYVVILVLSEQPIPPPRASLDEDVVALEAAGAHLEREESIRVR